MTAANGHKSLLEALLAVQAEAPTLTLDSTNPHFGSRFASLKSVVASVAPVLTKHGLTWRTFPTTNEHGQPALRYRLQHVASGEMDEDVMPLLLAKNDPQGLGSSVTYARRYALCAVLNLVADDDDDGHQASQRRPAGASSDLTAGKRNTGEPSPAQKGKLAQVMRPHKPVPPHVLAACLLKVGVKNVPAGALESGAWIEEVNAGQMSALIDLFQDGALPTGESDVPSDLEPAPVPVGDTSDLPYD